MYDDDFVHSFDKNFYKKLRGEEVTDKDLKQYKSADYVGMMKGALDFSDAIIIGSENVNPELLAYAHQSNKPILGLQPMDSYIDAYSSFYDELVDELVSEGAVN